MKKHAISLILFLCALIINISQSKAQCVVVGTDTSGNVLTVSISCNFPVYISTGDEQTDNANYKAQKEAWIISAPEDYATVNSLTDIYFEIHQNDFTTMSNDKQTAILGRPELYHITQ